MSSSKKSYPRTVRIKVKQNASQNNGEFSLDNLATDEAVPI
jgi:hypothetical protein